MNTTAKTNLLKEKFLKKGFWLYFFTFLSAPIGYIMKIIISGELDVKDIGIIYGVISLVTLLASLNDFGFTESFKFFIPKYFEKKSLDKAKTVLFLGAISQIITSVIIFFILFFGANFIGTHYFNSPESINILKIFSTFFILINILQISTTFFSAIQNTFLEKGIAFLRSLLNLAIMFILVFLDNITIDNIAYLFIISLFLTAIISSSIFWFRYYRKYFKNTKIILEKKFITGIFKYSIIALFSAQIGTLLSQVDMQMVIYMLGTKDAGYYSNYLSLVTLPFLFIGPLLGFLLPVFSQLNAQKDKENILKVKNSLFKYFGIIGISAGFFLLGLSKNFAYILFGEKFIPSGEILIYSSAFLVFNFLLQINFAVLGGIGRVKDRAEILAYALILNFITNIIFINIFGVAGAALATGLGWIFIFFFSEKKLQKEELNLKSLPTYLIKTFIISTVMAIILSQICLVKLFGRLEALGILFIIFFLYLGIILIINKTDTLNFIKEIKKIKNKKL